MVQGNFRLASTEFVACREGTDKQTNKQTDKQTNRLTNILSKTNVFESNKPTPAKTYSLPFGGRINISRGGGQ